MPIGTSDGQTFNSWAEWALGLNSYHKDEDKPDPNTVPNKDQSRVPQRFDADNDIEGSQPRLQSDKFVLDQDHHVPLVASALMDANGKMYGMAIDHRVKISDQDKDLLALHEGTELPYMNDLVKGGMKPSDAYAEAHKWATARETAASIAQWGPEGHEAYKERMREAAAIASQPSDRERHLDAHTTRYQLDEHELGRSFNI